MSHALFVVSTSTEIESLSIDCAGLFRVCPIPIVGRSDSVGPCFRCIESGYEGTLIDYAHLTSGLLCNVTTDIDAPPTREEDLFEEMITCHQRHVKWQDGLRHADEGMVLENCRVRLGTFRFQCEIHTESLRWWSHSPRLRSIAGHARENNSIAVNKVKSALWFRTLNPIAIPVDEVASSIDHLSKCHISAKIVVGACLPCFFSSPEHESISIGGCILIQAIHENSTGGGILSCHALSCSEVSSPNLFSPSTGTLVTLWNGMNEHSSVVRFGVIQSSSEGSWLWKK